jgi:hypothetical protein
MEFLTPIYVLINIAVHMSICNASPSLNFEKNRPYLLASLIISSLTQVRITGTAFSIVTEVLNSQVFKALPLNK